MKRKPRRSLTKVETGVLGVIHSLYVANGKSSLTVTEIAEQAGKSWNATREAIYRLTRKGKVAISKGVPGSVRPVA
jgi:DNA-binding FadR family transcriptional regulator